MCMLHVVVRVHPFMQKSTCLRCHRCHVVEPRDTRARVPLYRRRSLSMIISLACHFLSLILMCLFDARMSHVRGPASVSCDLVNRPPVPVSLSVPRCARTLVCPCVCLSVCGWARDTLDLSKLVRAAVPRTRHPRAGETLRSVHRIDREPPARAFRRGPRQEILKTR